MTEDPSQARIKVSLSQNIDADTLDEQTSDVSELVRRFVVSRPLTNDTWGGGVVLIGAGCSVSAGIPDSLGVIDIALRHIAIRARIGETNALQEMKGEALYHLLKDQNLLSDVDAHYGAELYSELFEKILSDATQEREVIREAINRSEGKINWAHLRLGQLVKARCIHTILTTNFDLLALEGLVRNGILPAVADGIEALNRVDPRPLVPQLVHIHGSLHNYRRINSTRQIENVGKDSEVYRSISSLLRDAPFLLIAGYRGEEKGLISPLTEALRSFQGKPVYWTFHGQEASKAAEDLKKQGKVRLMFGQDADRLFDSLAKGLKLGLPEWMADPVDTLRNDFGKIIRNKKISGLETIFEKHDERLSQLKTYWMNYSSEASETFSEESFASALLAGELQKASDQIKEGPNATQRRTLLAKAASNAVIDRRQKDAAVFLLNSWENLGNDPGQYFNSEDKLRLAEAFAQIGQLDQASIILRDAHPTLNDENSKLYWGSLQHRLGLQLSRAREPVTGEPRLDDAVVAYRNALKERTLERAPRLWASTQHNLGTMLGMIGERDSDAERLREAITAFREALQERTQERVPRLWAATQHNLGNALAALGMREDDTALFLQAVEAFRNSLEERSQEKAPLEWANSQHFLGEALWAIGVRENSSARLREAIAAFEAALEERTRERAPIERAATLESLAYAEQSLGNFAADASILRKALNHIEGALEEYRASGIISGLEDTMATRDEITADLSRFPPHPRLTPQ